MSWSVAHYHGALPERERMVSSILALKPSRRACEAPADEVASAGPAAACGGLAGMGVAAVIHDEFSVEEFLDLDGLEDCAELGDDAAPEQVHGDAEEKDKLSSDRHGPASLLAYEPMALPVPHQMANIPLPDHDAEDLQWLSCIMDDSLAELPPQPNLHAAALVAAARRPLEGTAAAPRPAMRRSPTQTIWSLSNEVLVRVKGKRSKRSRPCASPLSGVAPMYDPATYSYYTYSGPSGSPRHLLQAPDSSSVLLTSSHYFSVRGDHGSSNGGKQKKRGSKTTQHQPRRTQFAGRAGASAYAPAAKQGDRRCSHCGVNKTPQWRAGPEGAKTLCNACGVRYKSGRLFPEYRPACSPTFVSTIHSNFHRKVLSMRRQKEDGHAPGQSPLPLAPVPPAAVSF